MSKERNWRELPMGATWRSSCEYLTGDWRTERPIIDQEVCTRCLICFMYCPEGAIKWDEEKNLVSIDYDYCKGCGICANECPRKCIEMKRDE